MVCSRVVHVGSGAEAEERGEPAAFVLPQQPEEVLLRVDRRHAGEDGRDRPQTLGLDGGFVHAGGVVVADLGFDGRTRGPGGLRLLEDGVELLAIALGQLVEAAPARLVGGDRVGLAPAPAGEGVEVHAGVDRPVESAAVESAGRPRRALGARGGEIVPARHSRGRRARHEQKEGKRPRHRSAPGTLRVRLVPLRVSSAKCPGAPAR